MRREPDFFGEGVELVLVYIARKLKEALAIETLFTENGLDYLVEPDLYSGGIIFRTERTGAFFYVAPENQTNARALLTRSNYTALS
jgi:hypothetical protein